MYVQNLVDSLAQHFQEAVPEERHGELNTFVVYNQRSRVTSSAKRKRPPGSLKIHQTPDGSFLDLMLNARDMLLRCGFAVPQVKVYMQLSDPARIATRSPRLMEACVLHVSAQLAWSINSESALQGPESMQFDVRHFHQCARHCHFTVKVPCSWVHADLQQTLVHEHSSLHACMWHCTCGYSYLRMNAYVITIIDSNLSTLSMYRHE